MLKTFLTQIPAGVLLAAVLGSAATQGVIKDGQGNPVAGALVVAENTALADVTDANGRFELGTVSIGNSPKWQKHLKTAAIEVDALGRFRLAARTERRQARTAILQAPLAPATPAAAQHETVAARISVTAAANHLLIAREGHFAEVVPFDAASSVAMNLTIEKVAEFAKTNEVNAAKVDFTVLEANDSAMLVIDTTSLENAICQDGEPVILPDTSYTLYKIMGKTMYQWDQSSIDEGDYTATVFTSNAGSLFGTWNMLGLGQAPIILPADAPMTQDGLDSLMDMQRGVLKVAGTMTFGQTKASIDVQYGVCMGTMMGLAFQMPPITAKAKSCSEVEMINGSDTAIWSFVFRNDSTVTAFTYKGVTCTDTFASDDEPQFDCTGKADGEAPEEITADPSEGSMNSLTTCPGFLSFFTGGITIPPIMPLSKKAADDASLALAQMAEIQRSLLKKRPRVLR